MLRDRQYAPQRRLVTLIIDAADADAIGDEPVWHDGKVVGWVTSGGYGHSVSKSIALAYIPTALVRPVEEFQVEILGERRRAMLTEHALYDPRGDRLRLG